jgi:hypothetical protein
LIEIRWRNLPQALSRRCDGHHTMFDCQSCLFPGE